MLQINLKKRIKTERFSKALLNFIVETQTVQDIVDENGFYKDGGYMEYYLIHSKEFSREELEDNIKFCSTVQHLLNLSKKILSHEEYKTITAEKVLELANADIICMYEFHERKFEEWQIRVFELLTFQNLTC